MRLIHGSKAETMTSFDTTQLGSSFEKTSLRQLDGACAVGSLRPCDQRLEVETRFSQYQDRWSGSASKISRQRFGKVCAEEEAGAHAIILVAA
jgi:hypothetical protein